MKEEATRTDELPQRETSRRFADSAFEAPPLQNQVIAPRREVTGQTKLPSR